MINLRKARAYFNRSLSAVIEFRFQTIIWMLVGTEPIIMMFVWMELAKNSNIGNYSSADFAAYFLTAFFVGQMTSSGTMLGYDIMKGNLSAKLLRPIDPYWEYAIEILAEKFILIPLLIIPLAIGFFLTGAKLPLSFSNIFLFILALAGAWQLRFSEQYNYNLLTFWVQSTGDIRDFMWVVFYAFSGAVIPIGLMPKAIQSIIYLSPFPYMISFPVQIIMGKLSQQEISKGFLILFIWLIVLSLLRKVLWKYGLKRYGAFGA